MQKNSDKVEFNKKLTTRQVCILLFVVIVAFKVVFFPAVMMKNAGRDAYISFIVNGVITIILILLITLIIRRSGGKSFDKVLEKTFGKAMAKVLMLILFVFFIFKTTFLDYEFRMFLLDSLYDSLNWKVFVLPIMAVVGYLAYKGPRVIARSSEILHIFGLFVLVIALVLAISKLDLSNLLPVMENGITPVAKGIFQGFSRTGEFMFLLIIMDKIVPEKKTGRKLVGAAGAAFVLILIFLIFYISVFGNLGEFINDGLIKITQFNSLSGGVTRFDGILVIFWIPMILILAAMNIYSAAWCICKIFNIKRTRWVIAISLALIYFVQFIPVLSGDKLMSYVEMALPYITIFLEFVIIIVLLFTMILRKLDFRGREGK